MPLSNNKLLPLALSAAVTAALGSYSAHGGALDPAPSVNPPVLTLLGSYDSGKGEGAAEIVAYDAETQRAFVVNAADATVDVLSLRNPARPRKLTSLEVGAVASNLGAANSVAVKNGLVAVAIEANPKQNPGLVAFYRASNLRLLKTVEVGALPDMVTFTPDGLTLLVANEGEPSDDYLNDPEGSITLIDLSRGLRRARARTADFHAFNDQVTKLRKTGVRIYGPNASVAQDLEPEYITVSDDSQTAWVTLQENNALAVVDIPSATIRDILPLGVKSYANSGPATLKKFNFPALPEIGITEICHEILHLGGFSGLAFLGCFDVADCQPTKLNFITHTDRGPNAAPLDVNGDGADERPFALPEFQPQWRHFTLDLITGAIELKKRTLLTQINGAPLTGLPNLAGSPGLANSDEPPVTLLGAPLRLDPLGADLEGIVRDPTDGTYWMADEYRPSIYHFDANGQMLQRFVPAGANNGGKTTGASALPAELGQRRANRGFEGIAYAGGRIYAFLQSPLDNPDTANDANSKASRWTRVIEFDVATQRTVAQYLYPLEFTVGPWSKGNLTDKIGDAVALGGGRFLVLERDSGSDATSSKYIFRLDLNGATNLETLDNDIVGPGGSLETMSAAELAAAGIVTARKTLVVDLAALGYLPNDKPEGLALVGQDDKEIVLAVLNDNDFGLSDKAIRLDGFLNFQNPPAPVQLGLITIKRQMIDASDEDGGYDPNDWPVVGMYQPDGIASFTSYGATYLVTANEGDARDYSGYSEETRVGDVTLDPLYFAPDNIDVLQRDDQLGRLKITTADGDPDGDGVLSALHSFGGRSFSIWSSNGQLVFDSGADFERNTQNNGIWVNPESENRSDDKGPEPEGVVVGNAGGRSYAFIGLERTGGVMVYDVTDPAKPVFQQWAYNSEHVSPEGLAFVPASKSPDGRPLLLVSHEVSGTVAIYRVNR
ncbi:MAG: esterase-like activity of phytase family protein [Candidatus Competibacteraceae bacterium]|nr:esterase-like activity of phytase family protein [Candidatus Competibacteraceae bacterium]